MKRICSRMGNILLVIGFVALGIQTAHASMLTSGKLTSLTQPSAYAFQHHNQTWWSNWRWDPKPHPKSAKSVPVPATLLPLGIGFVAFIVWRGLRRRGPK
jgi:hypothetical protein